MMTNHDHEDRDLDDLLDAYRVAPADLALQKSILASATVSAHPWRELLQVLGGWRIAGPAFALSVSLGVSTALLLMPPSTDGLAQDSVWTLAGLDASQDFNDE